MKYDDVFLWLASLAAGLAMVGARLGWLLFRVAPEPPADAVAQAMWRRKRTWLVISELSALPAFATIAVMVGRMRGWDGPQVIILSMALGALGFAFLLDALQTLVRSHMDKTGGSDA